MVCRAFTVSKWDACGILYQTILKTTLTWVAAWRRESYANAGEPFICQLNTKWQMFIQRHNILASCYIPSRINTYKVALLRKKWQHLKSRLNWPENKILSSTVILGVGEIPYIRLVYLSLLCFLWFWETHCIIENVTFKAFSLSLVAIQFVYLKRSFFIIFTFNILIGMEKTAFVRTLLG